MLRHLLEDLERLCPVVLGALGLVMALRNQRRQLNAQMFIEFSRRFQDLLRMFPTEAWLANRDPSRPLPMPSQQLTECTLYAIQHVRDVYHLQKSGYLSTALWEQWQSEIQKTLRGPIFKRELQSLLVEFSHEREFVDYVAGLIGHAFVPGKASRGNAPFQSFDPDSAKEIG